MNRRIRYGILLLATCAGLGAPTDASQDNPVQILKVIIGQLQTGQPNPAWFSESMWFLIATQTNWSGVYPQLVQLGPVQKISVTTTLPLPFGVAYAMTAQHARGASDWEWAVSNLSNRIEYIGFVPRPKNATPVLPDAEPEIIEPLRKGDGSEACKKFPNLC